MSEDKVYLDPEPEQEPAAPVQLQLDVVLAPAPATWMFPISLNSRVTVSRWTRQTPASEPRMRLEENIVTKIFINNNIISVMCLQQQIIMCRLRDGAGSVWFVTRTDQWRQEVSLRLRQCPGQAETMGPDQEWPRLQQQIKVGTITWVSYFFVVLGVGGTGDLINDLSSILEMSAVGRQMSKC